MARVNAPGNAPMITLPLLAKWANGDLVVKSVPSNPTEREALLRSGVTGASIDTRTLQPGMLFVPLPGTKVDGHAYLDEAFARGAGAALCSRDIHARIEHLDLGPLVVVDDVTAALQRVAHELREAWPGLLIGVTGSAGKTTTKELIATAFETSARTLRTQGNLNNHWGVPLTILALRPPHQVAVVEMAMSGPGEIAELAEIAQPQAAVITNAGTAHLEGLGSLEAIAREKASLAFALDAGQPVFAGADSPRLLAALKGVKARVITCGFAEGADVRPTRVEDLGERGTRFEVAGFPPVHLQLVGRHQVANALAAIAVAREYRLDPEKVAAALAGYAPIRGRMEIRHDGGATLLVDCYNANPDSTKAALATLATWPAATRRIAVLGDMLELGPTAGALHRETAATARGAELWLIGAHAADSAAGGRDAGVETKTFANKAEVAEALRAALAPGVVVLVKASRGAALEDVLPPKGA